MIVQFQLDTTRYLNGPLTLEATAVDGAGLASRASCTVNVQNVDLDIVTAPGTDPVRVKYRAGNTGKFLEITADAKMRGRIRVNGAIVA